VSIALMAEWLVRASRNTLQFYQWTKLHIKTARVTCDIKMPIVANPVVSFSAYNTYISNV